MCEGSDYGSLGVSAKGDFRSLRFSVRVRYAAFVTERSELVACKHPELPFD